MNKLYFIYLCMILLFGCEQNKNKSITHKESEILLIKGTAKYSGAELPLELFIDENGMFIAKIGGWANQITGFDGERIWRMDNGVGPFDIDFSERELMLFAHWPLYNNWKDSKRVKSSNDTLQLYDGLLKMVSNYHQGMLKELTAVNSYYQESISFIGFLEKDSFKIPQEIKLDTGFPLSSYSFKSFEKVLKSSEWFKKPNYQAAGVSYNTEIQSKIEVRKTASGNLFIKPTIQGKEVGWFLFDSGAGISLIESEIINDYNFPVVGKQIIGGIGGRLMEQEVIAVDKISLGPLTISKLNFIKSNKTLDEIRNSKASKILGEPVMGVLGWDILLRSIVEMDMHNGTMTINNPANYELDKKYVEKLFLHWNVPYVQATFEGDKKGYFLIDSGAGNKGPIFHSMAVDRLDLLSNRKTESGKVTGAGGEADVEIGILDWIQVGGHRTNNITSIFLRGDDGEADLFTNGFLGGKVIQSQIIVFDYAHNEIGFIPR